MSGAPEGIRTPNPRLRRPMLYPLSYRRTGSGLPMYSDVVWKALAEKILGRLYFSTCDAQEGTDLRAGG